ncbi:MAG: T9SS type A sorting domain-containing protein [Chitinophagaceae bacterium]|nr:MAG: T9SS type A sorting domain-containing protein [Chitinophagaceae bacterium]
MKKIFTLLVLANFFLPQINKAQGIYQLWGTTRLGGTDDNGVLFSTKYDGTGLVVKKDFTEKNPGRAGEQNKPVAFNNKLYTVMNGGGLANGGIIAEFDPLTNEWIKKVDLANIGAGGCSGSMIVYNGKLYGLAQPPYNGGGAGALFEFNPVNGSLVSRYTFACPTYCSPRGSLVVYNNKFYGVKNGGLFDDGQIFEFNPQTNAYTEKADFLEGVTGYVVGTPVVYNGKLYGVCGYGGANDGGTIYCYDPAANTLLKKADLDAIDYSSPNGQLAVYNNKLYGASFRGPGNNAFGGIFVFDPSNNSLVAKQSFDYYTGHFAIELNLFNNKLYGCSRQGGTNGSGTIFSFNPVNDLFQKHVDLGNVKGAASTGSMVLYNNKFYGLTADSAAYSNGGLFVFDPQNAQFNNLLSFGGPELRVPEGHLTLFNNKLYGTTSFGGSSQRGGIYSYDLATGQYEQKLSLSQANGHPYLQGGVTLLNNKMYGVTRDGGAFNSGVLYEYDPATNAYSKKHDFHPETGSTPYAPLAVHNNKLYGSTTWGSSAEKGNIFEFDPGTGIYAQKVVLDENRGTNLRGKLLWYNNRFFGATYGAGANLGGTIFEYNPVGNSFIKKADFDGINISNPWGPLTELNGKLYGASFNGGNVDSGAIFEYNPVATSITKKTDLNNTNGSWVVSRLTAVNNKLLSMANQGGTADYGTLMSFDPATSSYSKKTDFNMVNGRFPHSNELLALPAQVAPGSANSCINTQTINIVAANANEWIPFTDAEGRAVAEINANGNILGNTAVRFFVNGGNIRQNGNGLFYLDRNITITTANTPNSPVSIRLYIRKSEFESLKATAGSGIVQPADLVIYKNDDFCDATMNTAALPLNTVKEDWGTDYVYTTSVNSFSSFYFGKISGPLPVKILSFTGKVQPSGNQLTWKASCTNDVNFVVERSTDGQHFDSISIVKAREMDCDLPFNLNDALPPSLTYYRIKMVELNGPVTYSGVVVLERKANVPLSIAIAPNPVKGQVATLKISSGQVQQVPLSIHDAQGRVMLQTSIKITEGASTVQLPLPAMGSAVYYLRYGAGQTIKLIKE